MRSEPPTGDELNRMLVTMKQQVLEQVEREPQPAKRSHSLKRGLGLGLGITLLLGAGAGAAYAISVAASQEPQAAPPAQTFTPVTPTPTTPTPSATPAPPEFEVEPGQPASRYGLTCDTLVDPALVAALFSSPVEAADPIVTASGVGISIPRRTSIMSIGGTVCEWSNGVATNDQYGTSPDYAGVTISVTPRPASGWSWQASRYLTPDMFHASCPTDSRSCSASTEVNDAWVTMEALGQTTLDAARWQQLFDAVTAAVAAAGPASAPSHTERSASVTTAECEAMLSLDVVRSITSLPDAVVGDTGGGGWSDWAEARYTTGNGRCGWDTESGARSAAHVSWIHDGRWAFTRMLDSEPGTPIEVSGLPASERGIARCFEFGNGSTCAVDLMIGDDWYNVAAQDEATAVALAEAILQRSPK